jgi:hypothetical protein
MDAVDKPGTNDQAEDPKRQHREGFATTVEAGQFLGLTRQAISQMALAGQIPARRYGRRALRIPWDWLYEEKQLAREERPAVFRRAKVAPKRSKGKQ